MNFSSETFIRASLNGYRKRDICRRRTETHLLIASLISQLSPKHGTAGHRRLRSLKLGSNGEQAG